MSQRDPGEAAVLADLLVQIGNGDTAAFSDFYQRTSARAYGLILRVLRDNGYSEEVLQELYLDVWRSARTFDSSAGSAVSWLLTIAHRRSVDRVRSEQAFAGRDARYAAANWVPPHDNVADAVIARTDSAPVADCMETLTTTQRSAVELAYYGGRTYREVADELGVGLPAIKSRIRDGLRRLRDCVAGVSAHA